MILSKDFMAERIKFYKNIMTENDNKQTLIQPTSNL